jgi:putative oxidoreductase
LSAPAKLSAVHDADLGLLIIAVAIGGMITAHGYNDFFGSGRLPGAGRWFDSLGIRPGIFHAWAPPSSRSAQDRSSR